MLWLLILLVVETRPVPALTPGVVRPLSVAEVCAVKWGRDHRHVTPHMRREVFARYGIPWSQRARFELDHYIPRELGGADDVRNLWPQPYHGTWNAYRKDLLENVMHRKVCAGTMTLGNAQTEIRDDWISAYQRHIG